MSRKRKTSSEIKETKRKKMERRRKKNLLHREKERRRNADWNRRLRTDDKYRAEERNKDSEMKRNLRTDDKYRAEERNKDSEMKRNLRTDDKYRAEERNKDSEMKRNLRTDDKYRAEEQATDKNRHRNMRQNPETSKELKFSTWEKLLAEYVNQIEDGPTHVCSSCGGLWFHKSMHPITRGKLQDRKCSEAFITTLLYKKNESDGYALCGTCYNSAIKGQIPKRNLTNGFEFPDLPPLLRNLTQLEERLVSPRIPFMQLRSLGVYQQKGLRGNVVNVPNDLDLCAKVLPRNFDDVATVQVKLMRRMAYQSPYMYENIRPLVVFEAAKYLCESELYRKEQINLSDSWLLKYPERTRNFLVDEEFVKADEPMETECEEKDDENSDEEEHVNPGADETLVMQEDNRVVKIAPGEEQIPLSWLMDTNAEQLSFPSIYGGVPRKFKPGLKISLVDIARSEARRYDRRAVKPEKILYTAKLLQNQQLADQINICLRKRKGCRNLTAGNVKQEEIIDRLISHDDGFKCLKKIKSSPAYWQNEEKKIFAMIRQTFIPTIFLTVSAAETKWPELLIILERVHHGREISKEEALLMTFQQKAALIRSDPCICALYFDNRFRALLNLILNKKNGAFSPYELVDYYNKIEFAHRGSAHNHGLFWLKDAPIYDPSKENSAEACVEFIDSFITCSRFGDAELEEVIGFQVHKHTHTCKRKTKDGGFKCRFNLPLPPMSKTMILVPLTQDNPSYKQAKLHHEQLQFKLRELGPNYLENIPFEQFVRELGLNEDLYILAIRSSITREKIFLKRRTCDIFINAYNEKILKAWRANMDIQFILNPYACCKYCISYLTKSSGGMSKLLRDVDKELSLGNSTLKEKIKVISNKFINAVEISAQEAAYYVLGLNLTNCTRDDVFINTGPPEERVGMLKSAKELEEIEDTSEDIYVSGLLEHYIQRPLELENISLAEFASMYTFAKKTSRFAHHLIDGSGFLIPRQRPRIVRYRRYNREQDPSNYYREQLMLYVPWRCEESELSLENVELKYNNNLNLIHESRKLIDPAHGGTELEDLVPQIENELDFSDSEHPKFDIISDYETDIFDSIEPKKPVKKFEFLMSPKQIENDDYSQIIRTLNDRQRRYFLHIVRRFSAGLVPFYEYLAGSGGVGKSHVITAIVQYLLRIQCREVGISLENFPVLICAPTGKAAFNVFGVTVHCALRLPPNEFSGNLAKLPEDVCNSLRVKFGNLRLIIIDEVSMLSLVKFQQIDSRLQQIFQNNQPFGGMSVLVVGDFYQIRPIMGQFVFETSKRAQFGNIIGNQLWSLFRIYELLQIMRQGEDLQFARALNNMARGQMTEEDIELFKSREISNGLTPPAEAIHLFWTNAECAVHNESVHNSLNTQSAISYAIDSVKGTTSEQQKQQFLQYVRTLKATDADGLPAEVRLQVGAQYMVSTNVKVSDGIFNGSTGELVHICFSTTDNGSLIPSKVYMKFENALVGVETRRTHVFPNNFDRSWTPISIMTKELNKVGFHQGLVVTRQQIPLLAANGITIVKSQGSGYHFLVMHIHRSLRRDLAYVAASRAYTLDGFYIDGEFRPPGPPPEYLTREIRRLNENPVQLSLRFLQDTSPEFVRLIFHNVQSLRKHHLDILCDSSYTHADFVCFVEPWMLQSDIYSFPTFDFVRRENCQGIRNSYGSFLGSNTHIENYNFQNVKSGPSSHFSFTIWSVGKVICCMIYRSPSSSYRQFVNAMEEKLMLLGGQFVIVFGDFNLNLKNDAIVGPLFYKYGYKFILPQTEYSTTGGTQIDLCFSNFSETQAWYYESVFSYHKPICVIWPKEKNLTRWDLNNLEENLTALSIKTKTVNDVEPMNIENNNFQLPLVTKKNARLTFWTIGGLNLSLLDLKTLQNSITENEENILDRLASGNNEEFVPKYVTDNIIDACLSIAVAGTSSIFISTPIMQLASSGMEQLPFGPGDWEAHDNVFMPVHEADHWMLMVVQPKLGKILFLNPSSDKYMPGLVTNALLPTVREILSQPKIKILFPSKYMQHDSWNCGIYIVKYVDLILNNLPLTEDFSPIEYREELIQRLYLSAEQNF